MLGADFLALPVHAGGALVIDLHPIHADVALAGFGVARDDAGQCDEAAGVFRPAFQDGKPVERKVVATDDFFAGAGGDGLGKEFAHLGEHGQHFYFVEEALRGFDVHEGADAVGDFVELVDFEREVHAAGGAELVDEHLRAGMAFEVLEEQSGAAGFADAVGDFGDFEDGIYFGADLLSSPARSRARIQSRRSS